MQPSENIWALLNDIPDPEIPVISLVELGIIREVQVEDDVVVIKMTPTFSGCPALEAMKNNISKKLASAGYKNITIDIILSPPWTTDWISSEARVRLKNFGIAPPRVHNGFVSEVLLEPVSCPNCDSVKTTLKNSFGSTPCRMIFTCQDCTQPFESIKPL